MKVLVTGGAGFIGSYLVDSLLTDDTQVTVVDNFESDYPAEVKRRNIAAHLNHPGYALVPFDLRAPEPLIKQVPRTVDVVVHLAGKAGVLPSLADPISTYAANVNGTIAVLEYARAAGVPKVVFASSSSVYGESPYPPWDEDDILSPVSPYGASKLAGEQLLRLYSRLYGIQAIALRYFTAYGPRQRPDLAIHKFARCLRDGRPVTLYGDGSSRRDYTYIDDIVAGTRQAMAYQAAGFHAFNLGSGAPVTLLQMAKQVATAMRRQAVVEHHPVQAGDPPVTWARIDKARRDLGYQPSLSFADGVTRFVDWYVAEEGRRHDL